MHFITRKVKEAFEARNKQPGTNPIGIWVIYWWGNLSDSWFVGCRFNGQTEDVAFTRDYEAALEWARKYQETTYDNEFKVTTLDEFLELPNVKKSDGYRQLQKALSLEGIKI